MPDYKSTEITLGYGGGAYIDVNGGRGKDLCWVFMNSGSLTKNINVPNFVGYNMELEFDDTPNVRNDVALGSGLVSFQGTLNFAITKSALDKLFNEKFLSRNSVFDVHINDGRKALELRCCYWNSFSISGNPRSVLTGSLNFVSTNDQRDDFTIIEDINQSGNHFGFEERLIEYWNTGSNGLETFQLNFTKETQPIYLNTESKNPAYIRNGKINLSGNFSSWKNWFDTKEIWIADKKLSFVGFGVKDSASFSFDGIDDTGKHNYSIRLFNVLNSKEVSWRIDLINPPTEDTIV